MKEIIKKFKKYKRLSNVDEIARRYLVMNGFDGALTTLGIIMGSYFVGVQDARLIVGAVLGGALAMGLSGSWGAYFTEKAERTRDLRKIERAMLTKLHKTEHGKANVFAYHLTAFINGASSAVTTVVIIIPLALNILELIPLKLAIYTSISLSLAIMFSLGVFLAKLSHANKIALGLKMVLAGVICGAIILFFA